MERQHFRDANRTAVRGSRFNYPDHLQALPSFAKWLRSHVQMLRGNSFPIPADVVRLSSLPSEIVSSYNKMWAYGAHFRCDSGNPISHVTYDSGVAVLDSEVVQDSMDVGVLERIYMVSYGAMNVVVMRVSWLKHFNQGRRCIMKNAYGFWTVVFEAREERHRRNRFILPELASQVFFVEPPAGVGEKVVIVHEPRSRRVFGGDDQPNYVRNGVDLALEIPLPELRQAGMPHRGAPREVPISHVQNIDANLAEPIDDAIFDDTQFVDENENPQADM